MHFLIYIETQYMYQIKIAIFFYTKYIVVLSTHQYDEA